ncbi:MAG: hypothetical protein HY235_27485 [Acidobacteria bacterium]|nr:hypothetical protein [Acidobacteriota bacterium]
MGYNRSVFAVLLVAAILGGIALWGLLLWALIRAVFSHLSGWKQLAERYAAPRAPDVWHWLKQTVQVGKIRYRRTIRLSVQPEALYLQETGLMRHPRLCIPWQEMHSASATCFYGRPSMRVCVGRPPVGTLEFPLDLYQALFRS